MSSGGKSSPKSILIVDDDRDIREGLGELLAEEGFVIEAAWNGEEALKRLRAGFRPHVILLDLMMPIMDGLAFRAEMKRVPEFASIPVIGVTAAPNDAADFECLRKPLRIDALISRIQTASS